MGQEVYSVLLDKPGASLKHQILQDMASKGYAKKLDECESETWWSLTSAGEKAVITAQYVHEASRVLRVDDRIPVEDRSTFALLMTMKKKGWGFEVADDKIKRRESKTPFKHSSNLVWYVVPKATTVDRNYLICLLHLQADAQCTM